MSLSPSRVEAPQTRARRVWVEHGFIWLELVDGRQVGIPVSKFPRLQNAAETELAKVRLELHGKALRWEELDEDLLVEGIVGGRFPVS